MEKYLTPKQAAEILHVSPETLRQWEADGKLKFDVIKTQGNHRRYRKEDIMTLVGNFPDARKKSLVKKFTSSILGSLAYLSFFISIPMMIISYLSDNLMNLSVNLLLFGIIGVFVAGREHVARKKFGRKGIAYGMRMAPIYFMFTILFLVSAIFIDTFSLQFWMWTMYCMIMFLVSAARVMVMHR